MIYDCDKPFNYSLNIPCSQCEGFGRQIRRVEHYLCHRIFRKDELHNVLIWCRLPVDLLLSRRK